MKDIIKLFKRLCKEENVFCHKDIMIDSINYMVANDTCIFFGFWKYKRSYTYREQMSFYKIQLQLASILIDNNSLKLKDLGKLINDTLCRYNTTIYDTPLALPEEGIIDFWKEVTEYSNKEEIKKKVIEYKIKNGLINV